MQLERRKWVPEASENLVQDLAQKVSGSSSKELLERLTFLADLNKIIHEKDCFNLNPATNVMNPRACLLYTSPSPRDVEESRMPSSA